MEWKKDIEENVRSGLVELLILNLLSERDMYGYEIRQMLAKRTNKAFDLKETALYGPLYRMSARNLITSHKEMAGEKRFRMYYHLEDQGKEYLKYGKEQIALVFDGIMSLMNWKAEENKEQ